MATKQEQKQEVEITFYDDNWFGDGHAAINIKCHNFPDLGDDLDDQDHQHVWDRTQEDWHHQAAGIAHAHGYSAFFAEGRSGGWLVPFRQVDATGQLQKYDGEFLSWSGCGGDKGQPVYPDVLGDATERKTFVAFRADIEELLELVPDMARQNAELYRQDMTDAKAATIKHETEVARRDAIIQTANERDGERRDVVDALKGVGYKANAERFDALAKMVRADWHEPDEQGVGAFVFGQHLDNAFGDYIESDCLERQAEIVVVLIENGNPYCARNLATLLSEAAAYRRAVQDHKLEPADCGGPSL